MEERKGYHCPVEATLDLIGGKYKTLILWHLAGGPQPRVEYSLTARGRSLLPILNAMRDWGTDYLHEQNLEPNCSMTGEVCCCEKNRS